LATRANELDRTNQLVTTALAAFPGIESMDRPQQIAARQKLLNEKWVKEIFVTEKPA
jgi:hypothetical protein